MGGRTGVGLPVNVTVLFCSGDFAKIHIDGMGYSQEVSGNENWFSPELWAGIMGCGLVGSDSANVCLQTRE
tara:strand:+ start:358 stop:570 length:213 start_codon:yes stop_codon:yes gene_type:complete